MSSRVDTDRISADPETSEVAVSVTVQEEDLLRLEALATAAGVGEAGGGSFAELLSSTLHRGIVESCNSAGLVSGSSPPMSAQTWRRYALVPGLAAMVVIVVGSYAAHWTWTGLKANGQVWDWMQLLLLPVAIGTFPLWLRFSAEMSPARRTALGAAVLAFTAFALVGYLVPLHWTGFRGHTLWSWLTLIALPITIITVAVWPKTGRTFRPLYGVAAGALAAAWIVTVIGGYAAHWTWTGYPGNTLWDWVKLFLAPLAITTFLIPELITFVAGVPDTGEGHVDTGLS